MLPVLCNIWTLYSTKCNDAYVNPSKLSFIRYYEKTEVRVGESLVRNPQSRYVVFLKIVAFLQKNLGLKECKYFNKGVGECPFGNKCFYKHADKDGRY